MTLHGMLLFNLFNSLAELIILAAMIFSLIVMGFNLCVNHYSNPIRKANIKTPLTAFLILGSVGFFLNYLPNYSKEQWQNQEKFEQTQRAFIQTQTDRPNDNIGFCIIWKEYAKEYTRQFIFGNSLQDALSNAGIPKEDYKNIEVVVTSQSLFYYDGYDEMWTLAILDKNFDVKSKPKLKTETQLENVLLRKQLTQMSKTYQDSHKEFEEVQQLNNTLIKNFQEILGKKNETIKQLETRLESIEKWNPPFNPTKYNIPSIETVK